MTNHSAGQLDSDGRSRVECWEVISATSTLTFSLRHIVVREIIGCFRKWGATLVLDAADLSRSRLTGWVDLSSIDTGSCERDEHIRSSEFFDVARFPIAEFLSQSIAPIAGRSFLVHGQLVLHGVARPIELTVTPTSNAQAGDAGCATYEVGATINRQAFGLHWNQDLDSGGVVVGDRIDLEARVQVLRVPGDRERTFAS
jgi:polyisoprenoid-binding protein YceI